MERVTGVASDLAGTVADPKAGLRKLRSKLVAPGTLLVLAVVAAAFPLGRRTGRQS